jgi:membrane protease YdiL (CAAX protease family)
VGYRFIDEVPWAVLGVGEGTWHPRLLGKGALVGTIAILITTSVLWAAQQLRFESVSPAAYVGDSWLGTALLLLCIMAPAALWEELAFRGYLYAVAAEAAPTANRALIARSVSSAVFGLVHLMNPGAGVRTTLIVMLAGWCLSEVRERIGLPAAFTAHLAWNWVMAAFMHAPVSGFPFATPGYRAVVDGPDWLTGGGWGPEGGVVAAVVLGAAALWAQRHPQSSTPILSKTSSFTGT